MTIDEKGTKTTSTCLRDTLNYATILYNELQPDRLQHVLKTKRTSAWPGSKRAETNGPRVQSQEEEEEEEEQEEVEEKEEEEEEEEEEEDEDEEEEVRGRREQKKEKRDR
uniref:Uncharacterized protein n=1 Tax=Vespula pensylvanica TaxID=30213 RepID=A0A834NWR6_VESPE|nr:hypothetical protein H0235_010262 [Vespula pensylvanica]